MSTEYEAVIGLEVHAQLLTRTKLFCGCPNRFGQAPNTNVCPVCMALPGALPVMNKQAVALGVKAALAAHCTIKNTSNFARKNYFYPDLPKGYQISQFELPFAEGGYLEIPDYEYEFKGNQLTRGARRGWKQAKLVRIHFEEDAGKNIHTETGGSIVDLNRAGTPLIEVVGAPDLSSGEEAAEYLKVLRHMLMSLGVCDGNMEEGSMRCDANVSIRPRGEERLGTRVEIKNVNSFNFVKQAINYEIERQKKVLSSGEKLKQQTRGFDNEKKITYKLRDKEDSDDYRYFPDPDLPNLVIDKEWVHELSQNKAELFRDKVERLEKSYSITPADAELFVYDTEKGAFFESAAKHTQNGKGLASWISNDLAAALDGKPLKECRISPAQLASLQELIDAGKISRNLAKQVFEKMLASGQDPAVIVEREGLEVVSDEGAIEAEAKKIIEANPKQAEQYRAGKKQVKGFLVGQLMKAMQGKASPQLANEILERLLDGN
jgi:aspartyl-tRNA(Asn)/glutamyl-tRNA(Gln) amidotransferase subunit B